MDATPTDAEFVEIAMRNPHNIRVMAVLRALDVPQGYLTAGCLFQTYWNYQTGRPLAENIKDYDVFYFDPDTSWEAEDTVIQRANAALGDLATRVEIRNQARVHLWYEGRFGAPIAPLKSSRDGIAHFLIECSCIGVAADGALYAPYGLADMAAGRLRVNPHNAKPDLFTAKARDYKSRWPHLTIER